MSEYGRIHTDGSRSGGQPVIKTQHCPNCEATEQKLHDFRQEVSDAVEKQAQTVWDIHCRCGTRHPISFNTLEQFIIKPQPDPLEEALHEVDTGPEWDSAEDYCNKVRAALNALGFEIRKKNDD